MKVCWTRSFPDHVAHVAFSPDGLTIALASLSGHVSLLDAMSGEVQWQHEAHPRGALAAAFSPDGTRLVTGGEDGRASVLDAASRQTVRVIDLPETWVSHIVWSGDGSAFALGAGRLVQFHHPDGERVGEPVTLASTVTSLFWHTAPGFVASCYGGVQCLAPGRALPVKRLPFRGSVLVALPSPDGKFIAGGNQDSSVHLWGQGFVVDADLRGYPGKVRVLAWGENGPLLATGGGSTVVVWPCDGRGPMGRIPLRLERHERRVTGLCFVSGGRTVVSVGEDGRVCQWREDPALGFKLHTELRMEAPLRGLYVAPGEKVLIASGAGGIVYACQLADD